MSKIRRLPIHIANQIAAGEVIERPSSVIKELVENSLDAGASRIQVFASDGGRTLRVVDDGEGMSREDSLLSFERFATSKLDSADDLFRLRTMGFRGEALASIASVAKVTCTTRLRGTEVGSRIVLSGGSEPELSPAGCPEGTSLTVEELFFNTPARLKFMRAPATEIGHIVETMTALALAHPAVGMVLEANGRTVFATTGAGDLRATTAEVLGLDTAERLIPISAVGPAGRVDGLISPPELIRSDRGKQWFFLNGRPIRHPSLIKAVDEAFLGHIPHGRHPLFILSLEIDPERVDVNVHPAKKEVRLADAQGLFILLREAVGRALRIERSADPASGAGMIAPLPAPGHVSPTTSDSIPPARPMPSFEIRPSAQASFAALDAYRPVARPEPQPFPEFQAQTREDAFPWDQVRLIGQLHNTFIMLDHPDGLYMVDQHNSHERYLYEQMAPALVRSQELLMPLPLGLSALEAAELEGRLGELAELGFVLEPFGESTWAVRAVPAILPVTEAEATLRDLLSRSYEANFVSSRNKEDGWRVTIACHSATRAGDRLNMDQMQRILDLWKTCEQPFTCPHGRPTGFLIAMPELKRRCLRS